MIELLMNRARAAGIPSRIPDAFSGDTAVRMIWLKSLGLGPEAEVEADD